MFFDLIYVGVH